MIKRFVAILLAFLFALSLYTEDNPILSVPIIVSSNNPFYLQALAGVQYSSKYESGIYYMNNIKEEYPDIKDFFAKIQSESPSLIITIGNEATRTTREYVKETPTLFLMVDEPKSMNPEQGKFCGFEKDVSFTDYFATLRELKPTARRVLTFYNSEQGEMLTASGEFGDIWKGVLFKRIKVAGKDELKKALNEKLGSFDALYLSSDRIYDQEMFEYISSFCRKNGIILMTLYPALVELGATFALVPDSSNVGVLAGQMANLIVEKKAECELGPVLQPEQPFLYLNEKYAEESGILIPEVLKVKVKTDRILSFGVELYYKKMYKSAKNIFTSILKKDPKNKIAKHYLSETINATTKTEIDSLWTKGETLHQSKKYKEARLLYKKILDINPEYLQAKDAIETSLKEESEGIRESAKRKDASGDPFQAIRLYQEAISLYPTNKEAQNELSVIRQREYGKIGDYFKNGVTLYNKREYIKSIELFTNILLITPEDKKSQEYQRLSLVKKNAMDRLSNCANNTDEKCSLLNRK